MSLRVTFGRWPLFYGTRVFALFSPTLYQPPLGVWLYLFAPPTALCGVDRTLVSRVGDLIRHNVLQDELGLQAISVLIRGKLRFSGRALRCAEGFPFARSSCQIYTWDMIGFERGASVGQECFYVMVCSMGLRVVQFRGSAHVCNYYMLVDLCMVHRLVVWWY